MKHIWKTINKRDTLRKTYIGGLPNFVIGDKSSDPDPSSSLHPQPLENGIQLAASAKLLDDGGLRRLRCKMNDRKKVHNTFLIIFYVLVFSFFLFSSVENKYTQIIVKRVV